MRDERNVTTTQPRIILTKDIESELALPHEHAGRWSALIALYFFISLAFVFSSALHAQGSLGLGMANAGDSARGATSGPLNALYNRPTSGSLGSSTQIGGYMDGNLNYFRTDGLSEGLSMELRHFNLFVFSSLSSRLSLMAEIEFEHGSEEISIETAQLDWRLAENFSFRGGIVLAPIGAFNQRHDAPLYEFIDRPLVSTTILPATLSLMSMGVRGKFWLDDRMSLSYELFAANPIGDHIIDNEDQRTNIAAAKSNEIYEESLNGSPAFVGRVALAWNRVLEVGLSSYLGIYNRYQSEGSVVDAKRSLSMSALDFSVEIGRVHLQAEAAINTVELPQGISPAYGDKQWGTFVEAVVPVVQFSALDYSAMQLNAALRAEYVDYNVGEFGSGDVKHDDIRALNLAVGLRPTAATSFRVVAMRQWIRDLFGNPSDNFGVQFGFATYF